MYLFLLIIHRINEPGTKSALWRVAIRQPGFVEFASLNLSVRYNRKVRYMQSCHFLSAHYLFKPHSGEHTMQPAELRQLCTHRKFNVPTAGFCNGHIQANLLVLPATYADDFEQFCKANPKPCPLLEKIPAGSHHSLYLAPSANILNTLPRYLIWQNGEVVDQVEEITDYYTSDLVFFLLGCSFSFESALINSGISLRHVEEQKNVAMYDTSIALTSVGPFKGNMVVSMRPIHRTHVARACAITAHYPGVHGEPVHIGYPEMIGISDLAHVDYGDPVDIESDEIPVFWACGVTPQNVLRQARLPFAITHAPGCMFVADVENNRFARCDFLSRNITGVDQL